MTATQTLSPADMALAFALAGHRGGHEVWCRENLSIRDKKGVSVPLDLWPAQKRLDEVIERQRERKRPVRVVVLKARQVSFSVGVASEFFRRVAFTPGQQCFVVSEKYDSAKNLFGYYQQFQESYRAARGFALPPLVKDNEERLEWSNSSYIQVKSADAVVVGRSFNLRFLHLSEFAFWRDPATVQTALMQAVPDDADTMVIVESTANGVGGEFYDLWKQATNPKGGSEWVPVFFGWNEHPEYRRPFRDDREKIELERSLTREEKDLQQQHSLVLEQLNWRRWWIANQCKNSEDRFHQEMPISPEEAFLTSGRPRFDVRSIARMPTFRDPILGGLEEIAVGTRRSVQFFTREHGEMSLFKRPVAGRGYVIGADIAQGSELVAGDPNYSVAQVLDQDVGEQVAVVRERLTPATFAQYLYDLGRFYNWAYIIIEVNIEIGLLEELLRLGYPLHLIYRRQPSPDQQHRGQEGSLGWRTDMVTRPQLVSALDTALREGSIIVHDSVTLQELRTFVIKASGKAEASQGCHDDTVLALALAVVALRTAPRDRKILPGGEVVEIRPQAVDYRTGRSDETAIRIRM
ncbi:MAG: hypothetical protein V1790_17650 [Planctomycetota bacterium]